MDLVCNDRFKSVFLNCYFEKKWTRPIWEKVSVILTSADYHSWKAWSGAALTNDRPQSLTTNVVPPPVIVYGRNHAFFPKA